MSARLIADAIDPTASLGAGYFIGAVAGAAVPYRGPGSLVAQAVLLVLPYASSVSSSESRQGWKKPAARADSHACVSQWLSLVYGKLLLDLPDDAYLW